MFLERQGVATADLGPGARLHHVSYRESDRRQDIALLPVDIRNEGDSGGAVGVVLDGLDPRRHTVFEPFEVYLAVHASGAAAAALGRDASPVVPAGMVLLAGGEGLLRFGGGDLLERRTHRIPRSQA